MESRSDDGRHMRPAHPDVSKDFHHEQASLRVAQQAATAQGKGKKQQARDGEMTVTISAAQASVNLFQQRFSVLIYFFDKVFFEGLYHICIVFQSPKT